MNAILWIFIFFSIIVWMGFYFYIEKLQEDVRLLNSKYDEIMDFIIGKGEIK